MFSDHRFLSIQQNVRAQLHRAGLVAAVDVPESGGEHVATESIEGFININHVFGRGVKFVRVMSRVVHAVFFTTDNASFDFEDDFIFCAELEQVFRDAHVLGERKFRAIEHVGVKKIAPAFSTAFRCCSDEWTEKLIHFTWLAMIRVQRNEHIVFFRETMRGFGKHDGPESHVLHRDP